MAMRSVCSYKWTTLLLQICCTYTCTENGVKLGKNVSLFHVNDCTFLFLAGFSYAARADSYKRSSWSLGENYIKEYNDWFLEQQTKSLLGRDNFNDFLNFMRHLSFHCDKLLEDKDTVTFLQKENYDIAILDAFNPCSFILAHKLGIHYIAFYPGALNGPLSIALPSPVSYIPVSYTPVFSSQLSNHMNLWGQAKNLFYSLTSVGQELVWSIFKEVAECHLESGLPPGGMNELYQEAELWAFNTDFSLEFPQPLMPSTVLVGGLLNKPAKKPLEQDLVLWISRFVSLGSMVSSVPVDSLLVELVAGFSRISQGVLWRFKSSALTLRQIHKSHPVPPTLQLIQWVEHILDSGGGTHLKPASLSQKWYQRYLLDLVLVLCLGLLGPLVLCCFFFVETRIAEINIKKYSSIIKDFLIN